MPRDGSGVYSIPLGTDAISDQTIESTKYNVSVHDFETDANLPRPIVAGGTGATSPAGALANLGGEAAGQVVANYDIFQFLSGSFISVPGATAAPDSSHYWLGIAYVSGNNAFLEARAIDGGAAPNPPNPTYVRQKLNDTWGAWVRSDPSDCVAKAGDTMTGTLVMSGTATNILMNKAAGGAANNNNLSGYTAGLARWQIQLGNEIAEAGGNSGLNFTINRFADGGGALGSPFTINRANGTVAVSPLLTLGVSALSAAAAIFKIGYPSGNGIMLRPTADNSYPLVFPNAADTTVGYINTTSTTTTYATSSDATLKEDLKELKAEDVAVIVDDTRVFDFAWKSTKERAFGVIAQQAKDVYPAAFSQKDERWFVDYSKYVPVLLQELQALRARVAQLEAGTASKPA